MKTDFCAICGTESVVSDPESKPPYVHLSEVLKAGPKAEPDKGLRLFRRKHLGDRMAEHGTGKFDMSLKIAENLKRIHPAVFETYYRPVNLAGLAPSEDQTGSGQPHPPFSPRSET